MNIKLTEKERIKILNAQDIYSIMQKILLREQKIDQNREHFWVIGLENNNRILFIELVSLGSINKSIVEPMEVFSFALQKRAVKIILCHNHPSGELNPSLLDKDITDRLIQVGIIVKTYVIDHLIISKTSFLSFEETGLMNELRLSTQYVTADKATEIVALKKAIEIATNLKKIQEPIEKIIAVTGLSIEEIENIRVEK